MEIDYTHYTSSASSREGGRVKIFVLHTTEGFDNGLQGLKDLGGWWDNGSASSHFGTSEQGHIARYVSDKDKAWTQCYLNPVALSLEQCAFSSFSRETWFKRHEQLKAAAKLIQYAHHVHGLPIRRAWVKGGYVLRTGVCQHKHLGSQGCGHSDCGPGYPERYVRLLARYYVAKHNNPKSSTMKSLKRKVNRIRRHYGVTEIP